MGNFLTVQERCVKSSVHVVMGNVLWSYSDISI